MLYDTFCDAIVCIFTLQYVFRNHPECFLPDYLSMRLSQPFATEHRKQGQQKAAPLGRGVRLLVEWQGENGKLFVVPHAAVFADDGPEILHLVAVVFVFGVAFNRLGVVVIQRTPKVQNLHYTPYARQGDCIGAGP